MAQKKKKKGKVIQMLSPESYIKQKARSLPIFECVVNSGWKEDGIAHITVARKHNTGNYTVGMYLIDLKCLGVKDAQYFFNISPFEYRDLIDETKKNIDIEKVDYTLVHNIIYAGIEFAEDYGFRPHKDFTVAEYILEEDSEDIELIEIECGKDNKPFFLRGPLDSDQRAKQIIAQLEKTAGSGNYTFVDAEDVPWDDDFTNDDIETESFDDMTTQEKLGLIMDFIKRADNLSLEEADDLADLIESVFLEFIDLDKVDDYYENFENELDRFEIVEKVPDEMLKGCGIPPEQLDEFKTDFDEVEQLISDGERNAANRLKKLNKLYRENAALQYLEMFLLQTKESKKLGSFVEKSIKIYPHFPLIYLFSRIHDFNNTADNNNVVTTPEVDIDNIIEKLFSNRKILYRAEIFYMIFFLIIQTAETLNMEQMEALDELIYDLDLFNEDVEILKEVIKMAKMTFVVGLIERLNTKN